MIHFSIVTKSTLWTQLTLNNDNFYLFWLVITDDVGMLGSTLLAPVSTWYSLSTLITDRDCSFYLPVLRCIPGHLNISHTMASAFCLVIVDRSGSRPYSVGQSQTERHIGCFIIIMDIYMWLGEPGCKFQCLSNVIFVSLLIISWLLQTTLIIQVWGNGTIYLMQ